MSRYVRKKIYGNIQKVEKKNITGMTYQLSNETGHGEITVYRVFTGIELYYNDMHMEYCNQNQATVKNMRSIHQLNDEEKVKFVFSAEPLSRHFHYHQFG